MTDTRYNNGKIYKLVSNHTDKIYIGSTVQTLSKRIGGHRSNYKAYLNGRGNNVTSFQLVCFPDCKIYLIELCNCNSKIELEQRERYYIESIECCNKNIPSRTRKEWYQANYDKITENKKIYREVNKDKIKEHRKDTSVSIKKRIDEWRTANKDKMKSTMQKYYNDNKESINEKRKVKIECDICKSVVLKNNLNQHRKSKKCLSCVQ